MPQGRWRLRVLLFLAVGLGATGLWLVAYGTAIFRELDLDTVDGRFSVRGEKDRPTNLAVVSIDDVTFSDLDRYPLPRSFHGRVIRRLKADGAKLIAYDIQFSEPSEIEEDNVFMDAAHAAGNVVFATTEVDDRGRGAFLGEQEGIRYARTRVGNGNYRTDPGGIIRRLAYRIDGLKSFAVVTVERLKGRQVEPFGDDATWIDYFGPPGTIPTYSFSRLYRGEFEPGTFRGKIVVVGASAPTLQDLHPTSFGDDEMSGPRFRRTRSRRFSPGYRSRVHPGG